MKTYLIATSNRGKIVEIRECLAGLSIELLAPDDLPDAPASPHESKDTFRENALEKARYYREKTGPPCIADDSGVLVEALAKELGVHTRRWGAGPTASDAEWIEFFLNRMRHEQNKRARFTCVIALIEDDGSEHLFEGHCSGVITESLEAEYLPGLPISACFRPDGCDHVFSALTTSEKNRVSHRGKAVEKLRGYLQLKHPLPLRRERVPIITSP